LIASAEVDGISPPNNDLISKITDFIQGRTGGIKVDVGTTEAAVDMRIRVRYGSDIPRISLCLKDKVARRIREMTGLRVVEANIRIQDVVPGPNKNVTG